MSLPRGGQARQTEKSGGEHQDGMGRVDGFAQSVTHTKGVDDFKLPDAHSLRVIFGAARPHFPRDRTSLRGNGVSRPL